MLLSISTSNTITPHGTCIAGIGGFAEIHHRALEVLEKENRLHLLATCDPRHGELSEKITGLHLTERNVEIFSDFEAMLDRRGPEARLVTVATPIRLHAPMHESCVRRKLACYLEKPPTLDPAELERMIEVDSQAEFKTQVAFNYIVEPWRRALKDRLLSGEFGRILSAGFLGFWQRSSVYYNRAPWAGKLTLGGHLVLDSCFGNAMAHHIHNLLFFAGTGDTFSWAEVDEVRSELYRVNPIESTDTVVTLATTSTGIPLRAATTHACSLPQASTERIVTEKAEIVITIGKSLEIRHHSGRIERHDVLPPLVADNIRYYVDYMDGKVSRPLTTLADSRPFVSWNALNYIAAGHIHTISPQEQEIENALREFFDKGVFPSDGATSWAKPGGTATKKDLSRLQSTIETLQQGALDYAVR